VVEIPWIVDRPEVRNRRCAAVSKLVHVELAEQNRPSGLQAAVNFSVLGRDAIGQHCAGRRRWNAGRIDVVLQRQRNAVQRPPPASAAKLRFVHGRLLEREACRHRDVRVDTAVEAFDPLEIRLRQIERRELTGAQ
jgi:hypothetical protein